jgi:nitroreductase
VYEDRRNEGKGLLMSIGDRVAPDALLDLMRSRRSVRRYLAKPVPDEMLQQVLEAGRWAPSAGNQQPWAFIVVQDDEMRQKVAQHATYYLARHARVEEAPLLIVLCGQPGSRMGEQFLRGEVGMAGMQMMLQAHALGLGTCWVDGLNRDAIADVLEIPPYMQIVGLLTVGYTAETPPATPRKPLFEIVHYEVYESLTFGRGAGDTRDNP